MSLFRLFIALQKLQCFLCQICFNVLATSFSYLSVVVCFFFGGGGVRVVGRAVVFGGVGLGPEAADNSSTIDLQGINRPLNPCCYYFGHA